MAPTLPGFIAAVNTSVTVPDGATELYYMSYLYGFFASGAVYALLHRLFPAAQLDNFVNGSMPAEQLIGLYSDKWEDVGYESFHASQEYVGKQADEMPAPAGSV
jgi:NCS1 family nucleobase:cation symporter-1